MTGKNATEVLAADAAGIARAAAVLRAGGLVALPTETVYGLAARADDPDAVARIYAAKGRPDFNPLIVHVADIRQAAAYVEFDMVSKGLAQQHWPGPLTLVLPLRADAGLAPAVSAGLPTLAVRAPAHPVMRAVLQAVEFPLAAPSANRSGFISPTCAAHVLASLDGRIDLVLDGGSCAAGLESTIAAVRRDGEVDVLRPGPIDLGSVAPPTEAIEAPGQLASHYAPGKPVRLKAERAGPGEFMIGFGPIACDCNLSQSADLDEAARRLYACLHEAALAAHPRIAVAPVPEIGVGKAINDRLRRAAA
ncbi:L-threonylcarbamoyladenylate synthase [Altererythrobacter sp. H2]|uniref:L-threonylcarbamoyladenylate synthase n=1 Tax=Altererythrobacter sp. H2 TaxID=3108391 RepID=UPI000BCD35BE|nr:L-threonylcarbamoyladenylate synthase [Altererythrobacter sp. H2]OZA94610.1 MAG: threonylcarbamoyl-AMP synthase [Erythrobacter sp. 34-65-8]WRK96036.1 L-threonylcarbamoyladenylate synthase [Altererythrobacter sp. H2]